MLCRPPLSLPPRHLQPAHIKAATHLRVTALDGHFSGLTLASQQGLTQLVPLSLKPIFFLLAPRDHPLYSPGVTLPLASGSVSSAALCSFQPLNGQGLQSPALRPLICSVCPWPLPQPWFQYHTARWLPHFHLWLAPLLSASLCMYLFHPWVPGDIISGNVYWEQSKTDFPPTGVSKLGKWDHLFTQLFKPQVQASTLVLPLTVHRSDSLMILVDSTCSVSGIRLLLGPCTAITLS